MTEPLTDAELAEIRARADAATEGPWFQWTTAGDVSSEPEDCIIMWTTLRKKDDEGCTSSTPQGDDDCRFVASARQDIPRLLDHIEQNKSTLRTAMEAAMNVSVMSDGAAWLLSGFLDAALAGNKEECERLYHVLREREKVQSSTNQKVEQMQALLRKMRWQTDYEGTEFCPCCERARRDGCVEDCEIDNLTKKESR